MGSNGRLPPPHRLRRHPPGPFIGHHDSIHQEMHPHHGGYVGYPPYDMPPHPEIMEQKLSAQHAEMQKLATENMKFAATHGTLRQDVAAIQHELQMLHNHVGAVKSEREQKIMGVLDRIGKMEADLKGAEPLKMELHKARTEAQSLLAARDELVSKVQQLTEDNQRAHVDLQQVPALVSELTSLRQEYEHCRATYEYEKKVCNEHLESLRVMEKNYTTMASEVEKLQTELKKHAENDRNTAGPYAGFAVGQNTYDNAYGVPQGRAPHPGGGGGGAAPDGNTTLGAQSGPTSVRAGYDPYRGPGFHKGPVVRTYDPQRGCGTPLYDPQPGHVQPVYDAHRGPGYDLYRGPSGYAQRGPGGPTRGPQFGGLGYEMHKGTSFESPTGHSGSQGVGHAMQQANGASYGSVTVTSRTGGGFLGAQVQPSQQPPSTDDNHPGRR